LMHKLTQNGMKNLSAKVKSIKTSGAAIEWSNIGGQLIPTKSVQTMLQQIKSDKLVSWPEVHQFYQAQADKYLDKKNLHALYCLELIEGTSISGLSNKKLNEWIDRYQAIKEEVTQKIRSSREKDYTNPFRKMVYENHFFKNGKGIIALNQSSFTFAIFKSFNKNIQLVNFFFCFCSKEFVA